MNELQTLTAQRDELLAKIREIEESCEGIENENNAKRIQELNLEQARLTAQKNEVSAQLSALQSRLTAIGSEIATLSGTGIDRILEAIKNQRWYFFKNKTKVFMDKNTALLWLNIDLAYEKNVEGRLIPIKLDEIANYEVDGYVEWNHPTQNQIVKLIHPSVKFPLIDEKKDSDHGNWQNVRRYIRGFGAVYCQDLSNFLWIDYDYPKTTDGGLILPYCKKLIENSDYENNVSPNNPVYTEKERLQFTLDLFVQNELWPIFDDDEITQLYKKIYFEKPILVEQLQELQSQIESLQTVTLLSSEFDYTALLAKYDISAINDSVIKYYQAVQQWVDELMEKLDHYEHEKESVINDFNLIGLKLNKKYAASDSLTEEENALLCERQKYFASRFSLGMNSVKAKLLAVKHQADELEYRIDEIDNGDNAIQALALLEEEKRASFEFIAENTAKIIRNALKKIEYFEENHDYVVWAIQAWESWTESYRVFKTTYREDMRSSCDEDGIEEEIWQKWYDEWQAVRFKIEEKFQPIIEKELRRRIPTVNESGIFVAQQIIAELEIYRNNVDKLYREERKGIYQNFVFQSNGDVQDRLETESRLYKITAEFQKALQDIIFNCSNAEDRIFILNWAGSLLDIQIDDVIAVISDNQLDKISETILNEFSELKKKNYEIYLADAKSYGEEQARRDKQFNALLFKMRKGLNAK